MDRRDFLHRAFWVSGGMVVTLAGCRPSRPDPVVSSHAGASQAAPSRATVALVRTEERVDGIRRAIEMLDLTDFHGKRVFLKPNFNSADVTPGSTHIDTLRELAAQLQARHVDRITVGDRSGMGQTRAVMKRKGAFALADDMGFDAIVFDELERDDWVVVQRPGHHWSRGFAFPRPVVEAEAIVQTCCLKTHRFGGHFTMSLKNSVGLAAKRLPADSYDYMRELHHSPDQRRMIAEINTAYRPALIVMDGIEAFVRGGPDRGKSAATRVMLAATDPVAIDAVGVAILRHFGTTAEVSRGAVFDQEQIARAVELGVGVLGPEQIEIVSDDPDGRDFARTVQALLGA